MSAAERSAAAAQRSALHKALGLGADSMDPHLAAAAAAAARLRAVRPAVASGSAPAGAAARAQPHPEFGADLPFCPPRPLTPPREAPRRAAADVASSSGATSGSGLQLRAGAGPSGATVGDGAEAIAPQGADLFPWFRALSERAAAAGALGGCDWESVAHTAAVVLMSAQPSAEAAAELFDLLRLDASNVTTLVAVRAMLVAALRARLERLRESVDTGSGGGAGGVDMVTKVHFSTLSEKAAEKRSRKDARRMERRAAAGAEPLLEWLEASGLPFGVLLEGDASAWSADDGQQPDDGLAFGQGDGGGGTAWTRGLPAGTTRRRGKGFEEVMVPAPSPAPAAPGEARVRVEDAFPEWAALAFAGMPELNRIQSAIYPAAFGSAANLLVCAPTGAGKTNIAMMAVLKELSQHMQGGALLPGASYKIVYVAPMKALAAEVAAAFGRRLQALGVAVREVTGDMQLSKKELAETPMLVTTPEKWDVITRKGGESAAGAQLRLLILDEVHLLNDERGAVIETIVARTRRQARAPAFVAHAALEPPPVRRGGGARAAQVEAAQTCIRIVALSATLPSPGDVASFLGVTPAGLFTFGPSFRPIPLSQKFVGVTESNLQRRNTLMNELAYAEAAAAVRSGKQAMVFVQSRKETGRTAHSLSEEARRRGEESLFAGALEDDVAKLTLREVEKSRDRDLRELFVHGFGTHHAGMTRPDRSLTERLFAKGAIKVLQLFRVFKNLNPTFLNPEPPIKVLCCTATLAWGVNLPAHTVVIKGTQLYDAARGGFKDLGVLDVQQIFGRAGRPQFDTSGEGVILTEHRCLAKYTAMLTHSQPIESQLLGALADNLNAEVVLGSVTTVREGAQWLGFSYLQVRMGRNPLAYGLDWAAAAADPGLGDHRQKLVREAARELDRAKMVRFDERSGNLYQTEAGRIASHFYISVRSMEVYQELMRPHMAIPDILDMVARSAEFSNIVPREDEMPELESLAKSAAVPFDPKGGLSSKEGKANLLLQVYISGGGLESGSLISDTAYISQSVVRVCRALFELSLCRGWPAAAEALLNLAKSAERRMWPQQSPLRQLGDLLPRLTLARLEDRGATLERLADMSAAEIGGLLRLNAEAGQRVRIAVAAFPRLEVVAECQPITRTVLRVHLTLTAPFTWRDAAHGAALRWVVTVDDAVSDHVYHSEVFTLTKRAHSAGTPCHVAFTVPLFEPLPAQYWVHASSETWLGCSTSCEIGLRELLLPEAHPPHTELLPLRPLPRAALGEPAFCALYEGRFTHFNAIQTQAFHTLYHSDENVLLGAPTGSGKTVSAELTMLRVFRCHPGRKVCCRTQNA